MFADFALSIYSVMGTYFYMLEQQQQQQQQIKKNIMGKVRRIWHHQLTHLHHIDCLRKKKSYLPYFSND